MAERSVVPSLRVERRLLREGHLLVAGMDEVGRGALAGPVTVGVVVVDVATRSAPVGVKDSKLLSPAVRESLVPSLRRWGVARAVGHAEPSEIDAFGIIGALRLAGERALAALPVSPACIILDGSHDWLTVPSAGAVGRGRGGGEAGADGGAVVPLDVEPLFDLEPHAVPAGPARVVRTMVKADQRCASVAAASVLAKVERDAIMVGRADEHPAYGWQLNKGYSAPDHIAALRAHGSCAQHRRSWSLPGLADAALTLDEELLGLGAGNGSDGSAPATEELLGLEAGRGR